MANKMRWRYGDTNPVVHPAQTDSAYEIGDFIGQGSGIAIPASEYEDLGTEAGNQEIFHDTFLGVCMTAKPAGESGQSIRVATSGVFEFDCPAETRYIGDLMGVNENSDGDGLMDQEVDNVATANLAVGRVVRNTTAAVVLVEIVSTMVRGGPQTMM